ncbi:hypothetical protein BCR43DRAFT_492078 [Syncephalastrum racemosum]|uniref:DUF3835 domain-containing protein n=1 Tax=Syncephalastrum racemosum TaxID=13706 RepID=A0A1X2HCZ6_SYNRA|nr:hypothetical protein BCR43DRAFT_492078 [Syncephalastrum racemosum]
MTAIRDQDDFLKQIGQWASVLGEKKKALESNVERWRFFKQDYDALEKRLQTLPDRTSHSAMIPMGKLAFMPGKLIHTNEITVLLGDQYYAERSAKQALEILSRRKKVVEESLSIAEAELNALTNKVETAQSQTGVFPASNQEVNEEGLPIMEIREELPPPEDRKKPVAMKVVEKQDKGKQPAGRDLPESVQRARDMDAKKPATQADKDLMALFDKLEDEEDEELGADRQTNDGDDDDDEEVDDYDSDQFDSDIADSMADLTYAGYDDDEEYSTQGIVEHVDEAEDDPASQIPQVVVAEGQDKKLTDAEPVAKIAPRRAPPPMPTEPVVIEKPNARKPKVSRFKAAREKERMSKQADKEPSLSPSKSAGVVEHPIKPTSGMDFVDEEKPATKDRKAVSWGTVNTVSEHDRSAAPSAVAKAASYTEPMKEPTEAAELGGKIRTPADIFNLMMQQSPMEAEDDYPSLESFDESNASSEPIDLNELARSARIIPQELWHAQSDPEGARTVAPLIQEMINAQNRFADDDDDDEEEEEEEEEKNRTPSKLDTRIMRGAVMERDIEPIDVDKVEEDMDLREISASYHQKRLNFVASMGGFAAEPKPAYEVIDEELPLPSAQKQSKQEQEEAPPKPKKMSRFKAARLAANANDARNS